MLRILGRGRDEPENTEIYRLRPKKCWGFFNLVIIYVI
jgi:hypothetical protein